LLSAVEWPDKSTGNASSSEEETYTVNALGDVKTYSDRNGSVHTYSYDVLGRLTADAVTTLGSGVDGAVRRLTTAYDTQGNAYLFTSYNSASGGSVVNQVQRTFNGLGQLTAEYQAHSSAVDTSTTPKVQYAYVEMASGANNSRQTSMTYPNGRVLSYNYASGLDSNISRLSSLSDSSATLETYTYLGLDTVVKRGHPEPGVDLTYIKQTGESNGDAGDQYAGLDRFGRVVDQRWINTNTSTATDRFQYGYDRDSNVLYRDNLVNSAFGELFHANGASNGYDSLNQLTAFARGTLSASVSGGVLDTVSSPSHSQSWSFDALGNWSSVTTDGTGQSRTYNQQNEVTATGSATLAFDGNGNTTTDDAGRALAYDAWNRLVQVKSGSTVLASFAYDALGRRVVENTGTAHDLYYSAAWQVLEERVSGAAYEQYVWSPVYVDALVERDRDADGNPANGLEERLYAQQDANWNVTALADTSGNVKERYIFDPYGSVTYLTAAWGTLSSSAYGWVYLHQGTRFVSAAGLYNHRMRDESPTLGRWLNPDPAMFFAGDESVYRAEANHPTSSVDPSGLGEEQSFQAGLGIARSMGYLGGQNGPDPNPKGIVIIPPWPSVTNRLSGALQMMAGFGEVAIGVPCLAAPEPLITKIGGAILVGNGIDNAYAGAYEAIWGNPFQTVTSRLVSRGLQAVGVPKIAANDYGEGTNLAIQLAGGLTGIYRTLYPRPLRPLVKPPANVPGPRIRHVVDAAQKATGNPAERADAMKQLLEQISRVRSIGRDVFEFLRFDHQYGSGYLGAEGEVVAVGSDGKVYVGKVADVDVPALRCGTKPLTEIPGLREAQVAPPEALK
jgi:RHS repeat-associated protein